MFWSHKALWFLWKSDCWNRQKPAVLLELSWRHSSVTCKVMCHTLCTRQMCFLLCQFLAFTKEPVCRVRLLFTKGRRTIYYAWSLYCHILIHCRDDISQDSYCANPTFLQQLLYSTRTSTCCVRSIGIWEYKLRESKRDRISRQEVAMFFFCFLTTFNSFNHYSMVVYPVGIHQDYFKRGKESLENKILFCLNPNFDHSIGRGGCIVGQSFVYALLDWWLNL